MTVTVEELNLVVQAMLEQHRPEADGKEDAIMAGPPPSLLFRITPKMMASAFNTNPVLLASLMALGMRVYQHIIELRSTRCSSV